MPVDWLTYAVIYSANKIIQHNFKKTKRKINSPVYKVRDEDIKLSSETSLPIAYGTNKINGQIIYREDTAASITDIAVAFCEGEIDDIGALRFDEAYADVSEKITYTKYTGNTTQLGNAIFEKGVFNVQAYQDAWTFADYPDSNMHSQTSARPDGVSFDQFLRVRDDAGGEENRAYLDFVIDNLPVGLTFEEAWLDINVSDSIYYSGYTTLFSCATTTPFVDTEITWNTQPATIDTIVASPYLRIRESQDVNRKIRYNIDSGGVSYLQDQYENGARPIIALAALYSGIETPDILFWSKESSYFTPTLSIKYTSGTPGAFRNTAYIAATLDTTENKLVNAVTPNVTAVIRGRKIKNWNALTSEWETGYNTNPAWILYDLLTNVRYGLGMSTSLIDTDSFKDVAEYCDENITNEAGDKELRYECHAVIDARQSMDSYIDDILVTFMGYMYDKDGTIHIGVDKSESLDADFALTTDNIVMGSFSYSQLPLEELPNYIRLLYTDPAHDYEQTYVTVSDEIDIDERGKVELEVPAYYIQSKSQASRIALKMLNKAKYGRYNFKCRISVKQAHILCGDLCSVTHPLPNWSAKKFKITSIKEMPDDEIEIEGEEYIEALYEDEQAKDKGSGIVYSFDEVGSIPNEWDLPIAIGLTLTETYRTNDDGSYQPQIRVAWTEPDYVRGKDALEWHIFWKTSTGSYLDHTRIHAFESPIIIDVPGADTYTVKIETFVYPDFYMADSSLAPEDSIAIQGLGLGTYPQSNGFTWSTNAKAEWTTGKIVYKGTVYSINSGDTTDAYIWFDPGASTTVLQHSNTRPAFDADRWLVAYYDSGDDTVEIAESGKIIHAGLLKAYSIEADNIAANAVTAAKINVSTLSAIAAYAGKITAGTFQTAVANQRVVIAGTDNNIKFYETGGQKVLQLDDNEVGDYPGIKMNATNHGGAFYAGDPGRGIFSVLYNDGIGIYASGSTATEGQFAVYTASTPLAYITTLGLSLWEAEMTINATLDVNGIADFSGNVDFGAGIDVTGNITVTGTVDGVDVAGHAARHADGGADEIAITDLAADTNWRWYYGNGAGEVAEAVFGAEDTLWVGQGTSSIPIWLDPPAYDGYYLRYDAAEGGVYWAAS